MGEIESSDYVENHFVFVLCGDSEYIDTLHYSLKALSRFSKCEILVITDLSRNAAAIEWPNIIDVRTPVAFDNHQASIYLKTGLHKFLPQGRRYCYLDTDVVAVSRDVDSIFDRYIAPITFAADHSRLGDFSPYAVRCGCLERYQMEFRVLQEKLES